MEQSLILRVGELFPGSDIVRKFSFKMIVARDGSALLARENHILAMGYSASGGESAHLRENDCFGCLPPRYLAA